MTEETKPTIQSVLLTMLDELESLRANLAVQAQFASVQPTIEVARLARDQALKANRAYFDKVRKQIGELAL